MTINSNNKICRKFIFVNIGMQMFRGGGENFDINISRAYRELGYETELYSLKPVFSVPKFSDNSAFGKVTLVRVPWLVPFTSILHSFPIIRRMRGFRGIPRMLGQVIFELRVFLSLWMRRKEEFVVQTCGLPLVSFLVNRILGKTGIVRMPGPILSPFYACFCLRSSMIIANGDAYRSIKEKYTPQNLCYVNVGINWEGNANTITRDKARENLRIEGDRFIVLYVGRLIEVKNLPLLIEGFALFDKALPNSKLFIIGDGSQRKQLQHIINKHNLQDQVELVGHIQKEELACYYNAADVVALTSHYDNFPNVLIEALSHGVPCIGTRVGGIPDIIQDGKNGFLVQAGDKERLARAMLRVAHGEIGMHRDEIIADIEKKYNWGKSAKALLDITHNHREREHS